MNNNDGGLFFNVGLNTTQLSADVEKAKKQLSQLGSVSKDSANTFEGAFKKAGSLAAGYIGAAALGGLVQQVIAVRGQFQQLEVAFTTMLGSKAKSAELMAQMVQTAAKTPFTLQEVANGAKQLLAYQVAQEDVNGTLIRLGNISAGLGVPLNRLITVYGQVKAKGNLMGDDLRQFTEAGIPMIHELAKQFGVADSAVSKMVESGQIGFPAVQKVIENLTDKGGMFFNLMEEQSKTVTGQISNLQDAISRMFNEIGAGSDGLISGGISGLSFLVEHYESIGKILTGLIGIYGTYRVASMVLIAIEKSKVAGIMAELAARELVVASAGLTTLAEARQAIAMEAGTATIYQRIVAQLGLNAAVLANPYVLATMAVIALGVGIWALADSTTAAEKAQKSLNEYNDQAAKDADKLKSSTENLVGVINSETESKTRRIEKYKELQLLYPDVLKNMDYEVFTTMELAKQQKLLNEARDNQASTKITKDVVAAKQNLAQTQSTGGQAMYAGQGVSGAKDYMNAIEEQKIYLAGLERKKRMNDEAVHDAKVENMPIRERLTYYNTMIDLLKKQRTETEAMKKTDFTGGVISTLSKQIDEFVNKAKGLSGAMPKTGTKAFWESEQKAAEESLEKIDKTDANWSGFIKKRNEAVSKLKMWDYDAKPDNKANDVAKKLAEEKMKLNQDIANAEEDEKRRSLSRVNEAEQSRINLLQDGFEKEYQQLLLNQKIKSDAIKEASDRELKQRISDAETVWKLTAERKPDGELKKNFKDSPEYKNVALPESVTKQFERQALDNEAAFQKDKAALVEKFTGEYAQFAQRRLDIDKQYYKDEQDAKAQLAVTGDKSAYDNNIAAANDKRKKAFKDVNNDEAEFAMRTSELFINLFGDTSTKSVAEIRKIADEAKTLFDYLNTTDAKSVVSQDIGGKTYSKEYLLSIQADPQKMAEIKAQIESLIQTANQGDNVFGAFGTAIKGVFEGFGKGKKTIADTKKGIEGLQAAFQILSSYAGQATGLLNAMSKQEGDSADVAAKTIGGVMDIAGSTMQGLAQGGIVGAAVALTMSVATKVFQAAKAHEEALKKIHDEKIAQQKAYNDLLLQQNDLLASAVTIFGKDTFGQAMTYANKADQYRDVLNQKGTSQKVMGWNGYRDKWTYSEGSLDALNSAKIQTGSQKSGFLGMGGEQATYTSMLKVYPDLINAQGMLNKELAQSILDNQSLDDASKKALESALNYTKEYDEALKAMDDYLTSVFGSLGGDMMTAIVDNLGKAQNAVDEFGKSASKTIGKLLQDIAYSLFLADDFKKLQDDAKAVMENASLSPEEKAAATSKMMDDFAISVGVDSTKANDWLNAWKQKNPDYFADSTKTRTAASKGVESMSQDTATELNGRFTAIQGHTFEINEGVKMLSANSTKVLDTLMGIKGDTARLANIESGIGSMKQSLDILNTKGIAIKP